MPTRLERNKHIALSNRCGKPKSEKTERLKSEKLRNDTAVLGSETSAPYSPLVRVIQKAKKKFDEGFNIPVAPADTLLSVVKSTES